MRPLAVACLRHPAKTPLQLLSGCMSRSSKPARTKAMARKRARKRATKRGLTSPQTGLQAPISPRVRVRVQTRPISPPAPRLAPCSHPRVSRPIPWNPSFPRAALLAGTPPMCHSSMSVITCQNAPSLTWRTHPSLPSFAMRSSACLMTRVCLTSPAIARLVWSTSMPCHL